MFGAAVGTEDEQAQIGQSPGDGCGHGRAAQTDSGEPGQMTFAELRMVHQAGDEIRWPATDRQFVPLDQLQHLARIPDVAQVDRGTSSTGIRNAPTMPMKWPTGVAVS